MTASSGRFESTGHPFSFFVFFFSNVSSELLSIEFSVESAILLSCLSILTEFLEIHFFNYFFRFLKKIS